MRRVLSSALFLSFGLASYWLLRPEIRLFAWVGLHNPDPIAAANGSALIFLKNHFADTVWCIAAFQMAGLLEEKRFPRFYSCFLLALPFGSELLQGTSILAGTMDWIDLSIYSAALAVLAARRYFQCGERRSTLRAFSSSQFSWSR